MEHKVIKTNDVPLPNSFLRAVKEEITTIKYGVKEAK